MSDSRQLFRPDNTGRAPEQPYQTLDSVLARARHRLLWLRIAAIAGLALLCLSGLAVFGALLLGSDPSGSHLSAIVRWLCLGMLGGVAIAGPIAVALSARRASPTQVASRLARADPRLRSLLLSAVQLRRLGPESRGLSTALIEAQAAFASEQANLVDLRRAIGGGAARTCLALGLCAALLVAALWRGGPPVFRRGLAALRRLPPTARAKATVEPITGDVELTYAYPAHTHLAPKTVSGTNGEIEAPAGTQVSLHTRADRAVNRAEVVVNGAAQALNITGDRLLAGSFVVSQAGNYFFRFGPEGHPIAEGPPIGITVQLDAPPQISLNAPPEELEVEAKDSPELRYQATDDFGLTEIRLVYRLPGAEKESAVTVRKLADSQPRLDGTVRFDLEPLHLMAGDQITYALEAVDNDDVAGPKIGRSRAQRFKIFSQAEHHREALARVRALWERLLGLLGDRLDQAAQPPATGTSAIDLRAMRLCQDLEHEGRGLLKDQSQDKGLATALLNVAHGERRRASATDDEQESRAVTLSASPPRVGQPRRALASEIEGLERDVLYLEALLDQSASEDLSALVRELASRRRELSALLERYRKNPTPELKEQIAALFNRLKARTAELAGRMQELAKGLTNQPHLNLEALPKGLGSDLSQVEQALASADVDQALKSLDQLAGQLDRLRSELDKSRGGENEENRELAQKVQEFKDNLDEVQRTQSKIASETEELRHEVLKALAQRTPVSKALLDKLRADTQRAKQELDQVPETGMVRGEDDLRSSGLHRESPTTSLPQAKEWTEELDQALQSKDLEQALHSAEQALQSVGSLQGQLDRESLLRSFAGRFPEKAAVGPSPQAAQARSHLQQASSPLQTVRDELRKLFPEEKSLLKPAQKEQLGQLQREEGRAQERAQSLDQKLEQIGKEAPIFDPAARETLRSAGEHMRDAEQHLGQREPGAAGEEERAALDQLSRLSKAIGQSRGGRGGGVPNPFALGPSGGEGDSNGAPEAADRERVVVPGADQYQVPAQFRRDILDAMKQKAPKLYEDQVKHYYQEIVR